MGKKSTEHRDAQLHAPDDVARQELVAHRTRSLAARLEPMARTSAEMVRYLATDRTAKPRRVRRLRRHAPLAAGAIRRAGSRK